MNQPRHTLRELNESPEFVTALAEVFEQSPWVAEAVADARPFPSLGELHRAMVSAVRLAAVERQLELIRAYPDLVSRLAREGALAESSLAEHAAAGLTQLTPTEIESFSRLNSAYRAKFGFPFVICARQNKKEAIMEAFPRRLENEEEVERKTALEEICQIALLRLRDLIKTGWLSTHVLDTARGIPAAGVKITLRRCNSPELLCETSTRQDGRTEKPLLGQDDFAPGDYEICFKVGDYFGEPKGFLDQVPVRFCILDGAEHYHVPLLVSPYSYTTYRGS